MAKASPLTSDVSTVTSVSQAVVLVGGWRLDLHCDPDNGHFMLNVANVAKDGDEAGWCACVFDSENETHGPLNLNGTETE